MSDFVMARPIVEYPDPRLQTRCETVTTFDAALSRLVAEMFDSMYAAEGVGLAANQIGVLQRVFVFDCPDESGQQHRGVVVNPVLLEVDGLERRLSEETEGCLSVPGEFAILPRPDRCAVTGLDEHGQAVHFEGSGLLARCFQHEVDHLNGSLYIDRLAQAARRDLLDRFSLRTT